MVIRDDWFDFLWEKTDAFLDGVTVMSDIFCKDDDLEGRDAAMFYLGMQKMKTFILDKLSEIVEEEKDEER